MKSLLSLLLIFIVGTLYSQSVQKSIEDKKLNLNERYQAMKSGSQTFKDYKVIKEVVLDEVWRITNDSFKIQAIRLSEANSQIAIMQEEMKSIHKAMQEQEAAVKDVVYDSTHISVVGVPVAKGLFLLLTAAIIGALAFVVSICFARVKMMNSLVKEKTLIADSITNEFEEFKKKAMEKQIKLSRELQDERNKLQDYRKA